MSEEISTSTGLKCLKASGNYTVKKIIAVPTAGSNIYDIKKELSAISAFLKCKILFNHNGTDYVCDDEGGCAKMEF